MTAEDVSVGCGGGGCFLVAGMEAVERVLEVDEECED